MTVIHFAQGRIGSQSSALAKQCGFETTLISIGFNVAVSLIIAGRMLFLRKRVIMSLGKEHARIYTGIAAMFIESGAIYSSLCLFFTISNVTGNWVRNLVVQVLNQAVVSNQVHTVAHSQHRSALTYLTFDSVLAQNSSFSVWHSVEHGLRKRQ